MFLYHHFRPFLIIKLPQQRKPKAQHITTASPETLSVRVTHASEQEGHMLPGVIWETCRLSTSPFSPQSVLFRVPSVYLNYFLSLSAHPGRHTLIPKASQETFVSPLGLFRTGSQKVCMWRIDGWVRNSGLSPSVHVSYLTKRQH